MRNNENEVYSAQELADAGIDTGADASLGKWPFPKGVEIYQKRLGKIARAAADKVINGDHTLMEKETSSSDLGTLRFIDLDLMDLFEFIDDEERTVQALKVGNSTAIIGFTLTRKLNILNEPSIHSPRQEQDDVTKIRLKSSKQVSRILPLVRKTQDADTDEHALIGSGDGDDHS